MYFVGTKKIIALLLVLAMALSVVACAPTPDPEPTPDPDPVVDPEPTPDPDPVVDPEPTPDPDPVVDPEPAPDPDPDTENSGFRLIDYEDPNWYQNAHLIDIDSDWPFNYLCEDISSAQAIMDAADEYFDEWLFNNTKVTDVLWCCFEQLSHVESESMEYFHEKMTDLYQESNGEFTEVFDDFFEDLAAKIAPFYNACVEYDIDWYQLAFDHCYEAGVRPWIYLRMNDSHHARFDDQPYHQEFWHTAKENGWLIGDEIYRDSVDTKGFEGEVFYNGYDYAVPEVRQWMLTYIEEVTTKYDAFGLQLDFTREIVCFDYLNEPEKCEIMNQFIRDVRAVLDRAEEIHGHPMKLMIRLGTDLEDNLVFGFDVATWAEEGLIDAVVPSPRYWAGVPSDIQMEEWRATVGEQVGIFVGFENNLNAGSAVTKLEHVKGTMAGYMSRGANGAYFNNFFQIGSEGRYIWPYSPEDFADGTGVRTYVVTQQDLWPLGQAPHSLLPLDLTSAGENGVDVEVYLGKISKGEKIYLSIGYNCEDASILGAEVLVNGAAPVAVQEMNITEGNPAGYYAIAGNVHAASDCLLRYTFENSSDVDKIVIHFSGTEQVCQVMSLIVTAKPF